LLTQGNEMNIKIIEEIARQTGMDLRMHDTKPRMTQIDDATNLIVASGDLTNYGENLIKFANAVENHFRQKNRGLKLL